MSEDEWKVTNFKVNQWDVSAKEEIDGKIHWNTHTNYQANAITTFLINRNEITKTFIISEKFNFQKISDKYEEKSYEQNIKKNLANSISQKLILRLSISK